MDIIRSPNEEIINRDYQIFSEYLDHVEYLIGYEGNAFTYTGDVEEDILSITAVHPMREDAITNILARSNTNREIIEKLITEEKLIEIEYLGKKFYLRKFFKNKNNKINT